MTLQNDYWGGQHIIDGVSYLGAAVTPSPREGYFCYTKDPQSSPCPLAVGQGTSIFICVESDSSQAPVVDIDSLEISWWRL
jgi:hypothetical protein